MNTLLFTLEYPPFNGGVANYYGNLKKNWPKPADIFVLNNNNGRLINKHWPILKWLPAILELGRAVKNNKIGHIIVGHILPLGLVSLIYCRFNRIKYSVVLHGMDFSYAVKIRHKKIITKIILAGAEKIICANRYTAELVQRFLLTGNNHKIITVNPGIEARAPITGSSDRLIKKYHLDKKIVLLSVGRLVQRKGFDRVIEAMPGILKEIPGLIYVILGNGDEQMNLKSKIENLKIDKHVLIINDATDDDRNSWYDVCDIFIMPSRNIDGDFEGFGIVYLEANSAGKPVIASRNGGVGDAVIDGLNGLLVDAEDINEIGQTIIELAKNGDARRELGEQGKQRAILEFNWQKQAEKFYQTILT